MRRSKGSHRIVLNNVEFRWRASGNDGYITIGIWPTNNVGPFIHGSLKYHETWMNAGGGRHVSAGDQIVVTNRIVRRIIEHAIERHGYVPNVKGATLSLKVLDHVIQWEDAVRASRDPI